MRHCHLCDSRDLFGIYSATLGLWIHHGEELIHMDYLKVGTSLKQFTEISPKLQEISFSPFVERLFQVWFKTINSRIKSSLVQEHFSHYFKDFSFKNIQHSWFIQLHSKILKEIQAFKIEVHSLQSF